MPVHIDHSSALRRVVTFHALPGVETVEKLCEVLALLASLGLRGTFIVMVPGELFDKIVEERRPASKYPGDPGVWDGDSRYDRFVKFDEPHGIVIDTPEGFEHKIGLRFGLVRGGPEQEIKVYI